MATRVLEVNSTIDSYLRLLLPLASRNTLAGGQADLAALYQKAGLKNVGMVFLMTDSQVADESFLVLINDMLASGEIPDLFADDEQEEIINNVRNEVGNVSPDGSLTDCPRPCGG